MSDDVLPDINVTRGEKALATVLAIFLLIGGLWVFFTRCRARRRVARGRPGRDGRAAAVDQRSAQRRNGASRRARRSEADRQRSYEEARENYRTDLDAGTPATQTSKRRSWPRANGCFAARRERARRPPTRAERPRGTRRPAGGAAAEATPSGASRRAVDRAERNTFLLRLGGCSAARPRLLVLQLLRRRRSAYFVAGIAAIIAATLQALVMAFDYLGDEIDFDPRKNHLSDNVLPWFRMFGVGSEFPEDRPGSDTMPGGQKDLP